MGFEKYYGFLGGETDQWAPLLAQDNQFIDTPTRPDYHLTEDLVDRTIAYIRDQQQANTGRPFFTYLALGACHAPLHAPQEFIAKYQGKFDQGWDKVRRGDLRAAEETRHHLRRMLCCRRANPGIQAWADLNDDQKKVYCRLQEVFAGFLDHADHHLGRLFAALDEMGLRDNTLIMVVSDNGASQEGLQNGTLNTDRYRNYFPDTVEEMLQKLDEAGRPSTDPHYPMGWAMAGNSPLKRWKQDTHAGGNTDPFIVSWPAKIKDGGAIRNQYHHLVDVVPTILEVSCLPAPTSVNGVKQMPLHGVSMAYTFTDGNAKTRKKVAVLRDARQPGDLGRRLDGGGLAQEGHALGRGQVGTVRHGRGLHPVERPRREATGQAEGTAGPVAGGGEEVQRAAARRPTVRTRRRPDPAGRGLAEETIRLLPGDVDPAPACRARRFWARSTPSPHMSTIPADGAEGVLACSGGEFGGWTLFLKDGKFHYAHNYLKLQEDLRRVAEDRSRRASTR